MHPHTHIHVTHTHIYTCHTTQPHHTHIYTSHHTQTHTQILTKFQVNIYKHCTLSNTAQDRITECDQRRRNPQVLALKWKRKKWRQNKVNKIISAMRLFTQSIPQHYKNVNLVVVVLGQPLSEAIPLLRPPFQHDAVPTSMY